MRESRHDVIPKRGCARTSIIEAEEPLKLALGLSAKAGYSGRVFCIALPGQAGMGSISRFGIIAKMSNQPLF